MTWTVCTLSLACAALLAAGVASPHPFEGPAFELILGAQAYHLVEALPESGSSSVAVVGAGIAAGAWSGGLSRRLGTRIPLEAERGHQVTVANASLAPRIQASWARRKLVATPMEPELRLAGTDGFAGLDAPPDVRRARRPLAIDIAPYGADRF